MPGRVLHGSEVHVDTALTNLSLQFQNPGLIAEMVAPVVNVKKESDVYWKFGNEERREIEDGEGDRRACGAEARVFDWKPTGTDPYLAIERALKGFVCDRTIANADAPVRPRQRTTNKLAYALRLQYEIRVATIAQDTGTTTFTAVPTKWDDPTADIETDVLAAKEVIRGKIGVDPNTIILPRAVANHVIEFLKGAAEISIRERSSLFRVPDEWLGLRVLVAEAVKNTAAEGAADALTDVWDSKPVLAWINPGTPGLEDMSYMWTIRARQFEVRTWRDEPKRGAWIENSWIQDEKLVTADAAHILVGPAGAADPII